MATNNFMDDKSISLGDKKDGEDKPFTGDDICVKRDIELIFNGRDHSFSSSNLRKRVAETENK